MACRYPSALGQSSGRAAVMRSVSSAMRRHVSRLTAVLACLLVWTATQLPTTSAADQAETAARFRFDQYPVNAPDQPGDRHLRPVAPAYSKIRAWVSSVGAGTGLFAADGGA